MSAYVFWGWTSQIGPRGLTDACRSMIIEVSDAAEAQARFEQWLVEHSQGEDKTPTRIEKVVGTELLSQVLTEAGSEPLDWEAALGQAAPEEGAAEDFFEQGYWADANHLVRPGRLPADIEQLRQGLPAEIRDGLNWSEQKRFLFLVSALSHPLPPPEPDYEQEYQAPVEGEAPLGLGVLESEARGTAFPEMAEKEATAIVRARNSVVAAWIWRRYAAETRLAEHDLAVYPPCQVLLPPDSSSG